MKEAENNFYLETQNPTPEITSEQSIHKENFQHELDDTILAYETKKEEVKKKIVEISSSIQALTQELREVCQRLGIEAQDETVPSLDNLRKKEVALRQEQIQVSANYPGDWTLLLRERMLDPVSKEKFIQTRTETIQHMKPGNIPKNDGLSLIKPENYQTYYQTQIDEYDKNVKRIFDSTDVRESSEFGKTPEKLGKGEIGFEGAVFADARKSDGSQLSNREKNIIEAHEKGHGIRDFVSEDQRDFRQSIDFEVIRQKDKETGRREIGYLRQTEEIAERMAQLKNYFGFKAGDLFTKEHLEYAKQHYIQDIGLDNNMTTFFAAITEHTVDKFIETINKYPL